MPPERRMQGAPGPPAPGEQALQSRPHAGLVGARPRPGRSEGFGGSVCRSTPSLWKQLPGAASSQELGSGSRQHLPGRAEGLLPRPKSPAHVVPTWLLMAAACADIPVPTTRQAHCSMPAPTTTLPPAIPLHPTPGPSPKP